MGSHRAMVHERTGRVTKDRALGRRNDRIWEMPTAINNREGVPPRGGNTTGGKNFSDVGGPREKVAGGKMPSLTRKEGYRCIGRERKSVECALEHLRPVDFSPGPAVTHSIPLYKITKRVEVKGYFFRLLWGKVLLHVSMLSFTHSCRASFLQPSTGAPGAIA